MTSARLNIATLTAAALAVARPTQADVTFYYDNPSLAAWQAAAGAFETITFSEFPQWTSITDQYESLGVVFDSPQGSQIRLGDVYAQDGWGLQSNAGFVELQFAAPIHAVAAHGLGLFKLELYLGSELIAESTWGPTAGFDVFKGAVSTGGFDRVRFVDFPPGSNQLDNIYFGVVPAPGAAIVLIGSLGMVRAGRRRARRDGTGS